VLEARILRRNSGIWQGFYTTDCSIQNRRADLCALRMAQQARLASFCEKGRTAGTTTSTRVPGAALCTAELGRILTRRWLDGTPDHGFELLLEEFLEAKGDRLKRQPLQHAANKCMGYQAARFCICHPA
jgi:hypothetical protein